MPSKIVSFALNTKQKRPLLYIYTIININKNSIIKQKPEINSLWQTRCLHNGIDPCCNLLKMNFQPNNNKLPTRNAMSKDTIANVMLKTITSELCSPKILIMD